MLAVSAGPRPLSQASKSLLKNDFWLKDYKVSASASVKLSSACPSRDDYFLMDEQEYGRFTEMFMRFANSHTKSFLTRIKHFI